MFSLSDVLEFRPLALLFSLLPTPYYLLEAIHIPYLLELTQIDHQFLFGHIVFVSGGAAHGGQD